MRGREGEEGLLCCPAISRTLLLFGLLLGRNDRHSDSSLKSEGPATMGRAAVGSAREFVCSRGSTVANIRRLGLLRSWG